MAYLTKSRFKLGLECPTKMFYNAMRDQYADQQKDDPFLMALAEGGFQVGEMAKLMYPGGIEITSRDPQEALRQTTELLDQETVILYEPALIVGHKYIRVDILEKKGDTIRILEVKAKSCEGEAIEQFLSTKTGAVTSGWRPYLEDIAFQTLVTRDFFSDLGHDVRVIPYLMLVDKGGECTVNGINQLFRIRRDDNGRSHCVVKEGTTREDLGQSLFSEVNATELVDSILNDRYYQKSENFEGRGFREIIPWFEEQLRTHETNGAHRHYAPVGFKCRDCQFHTADSDDSMQSGLQECFSLQMGWGETELNAPKVWDVWKFPKAKSLVEEGRWFMNELSQEDIGEPTANGNGEGLTSKERQWVQVERTNNSEQEPFVERDSLSSYLTNVQYPLHFIDFETAAPAIPLFSGYRPYQGFCFQFSHHQMEADGTVHHVDEFLSMDRGVDPTKGFVEALCDLLNRDKGSVFMYHTHENTYMNLLIQRLHANSPFSEEETNQHLETLKSVAYPGGSSAIQWDVGERKIIDMRKIVLETYWHPLMGKSNSIKQVLPAVLNDSEYLQERYGAPLYGTTNGIHSLNFNGKQWVTRGGDGMIIDPYKTLPDLEEIFPLSVDEVDLLFEDGSIANGGAAMTAWQYMQFADMDERERERVGAALKMYCELDTLAMVMIWEYWQDLIS